MVQFNINSISDSSSSYNVNIIGKALKSSVSSSSVVSSSSLLESIDLKVVVGTLVLIPLALLTPSSKKIINGHPW